MTRPGESRKLKLSITQPLSKLMTNLFKYLSILIILAGLLAATPAAARQPLPQADNFAPAACMFEVPFVSFMKPEQMGFECGYVTVPLRHQNPAGPTIQLPVAILRARGDSPRPDPLFLAQGGPGGDAFSVFALTAVNSPLLAERDIVIFNQRGTLYATPSLVCTETFDELDTALALPRDQADEAGMQAYSRCHRRLLDEGVDLSAFNSLENAADVDAIRQALGYEVINFYGVSYGTLLGLHLLRDFPNSVRTVILDSVVPTQINYITEVPQVTERIFDKMLTTCAADAACAGQYPNLGAEFGVLVEQLNRQPVTIPVTDPDTGASVNVYVDGKTFMDMLFQAFYLPDMYAIFPRLISDMAAGRYDFWQTMWPIIIFDRTFSEGMFYSVICAEDSDFSQADVSLAGIRPAIADYALNDVQEVLDVCRLWDVRQLPASVDEPVVSSVPTLVLAGEFDPITPPAFARAAADTLSHSYLVVDPTSSHGVAFNDNCLDGVLQDFLNNPGQPPDAVCVEQHQPTGFVPKNALVVPLLSGLNALDGPTLVQTGVAGLLLALVLSAWLVWPLVLLVNWLRKKPAAPHGRWLGRAGKGVMLLFGALAVVFVSGLAFFALSSIESTPMLLLSALSAWSAPLFVIPYLLALLAAAGLLLALLVWARRVWSVWGRLYFTLVAVCAVAYVAMLAVTGMMSVLL